LDLSDQADGATMVLRISVADSTLRCNLHFALRLHLS
jgi:hypothetical protein